MRGPLQVSEAKDSPNFGYNAATDTFQDLLEAGIIDPTKVCRTSMLSERLGPLPMNACSKQDMHVLHAGCGHGVDTECRQASTWNSMIYAGSLFSPIT